MKLKNGKSHNRKTVFYYFLSFCIESLGVISFFDLVLRKCMMGSSPMESKRETPFMGVS